MTTHYNFKNIRILLTEGFNDEQLRRLCYDVRNFRPVYDELARNSGKGEIIDLLLDHVDRTIQVDLLLTLAKELNPARYQKHHPYTEQVIAKHIIAEQKQKHKQILVWLGIFLGVLAVIIFLFVVRFESLFSTSQTNPIVAETPAIILTVIAQATAIGRLEQPDKGQISKCEWLLKNFPQSQEEVADFFGLAPDIIQLIYHQCPSGPVVQGVILNPKSNGEEHGIWLFDGACADGIPDPKLDTESFQGKRRELYRSTYRIFEKIIVSEEPIFFWAWCDEMH